MLKKILTYSLLLTSIGVSADYYSDSLQRSVEEGPLEADLRNSIDCLSMASGDIGLCDLRYDKEEFEGVISSQFSGVISSSDDLAFQGKTVSGLSKISARYSGMEDSSVLPATFEHTQNCAYVKSLVEQDHLGETPAILQGGDTEGLAFNQNAYYDCQASEDIHIKASSVNGVKQVTTGTETIQNHPSTIACYGDRGNRAGLEADCGSYGRVLILNNGDIYRRNRLDRCENPGVKKYFNCIFHSPKTEDYEYTRYYKVVASPLSLDTDSRSGIVKNMEYQVSIDYIYQKQRTLPVELWPNGWVPVQVGDITTFILAPVKPSFPVTTYTTNIVDRAYKTVEAQNNTRLNIGCEAESRTLVMTNKSGTLPLESSDIINLFSDDKCEAFTVTIDNLTPVDNSNVYWKVEYEWSPNEQLEWEKYARLLTGIITDNLLSTEYINQLRSATSQSTNDSQLIIKTLSEYIIGHNVDPASFVFTPSGLWAFLLAEGSNYGMNSAADIEAEIETIVERHGIYGQLVININDDGRVVKVAPEGEENVMPVYWNSFVRSDHAQNILYSDKFNLLKQAINIVDVSSENGDTTTLQAQMDVVADAAEYTRLSTIDKAERFLLKISTRSDIEANLCNELNELRSELGESPEECNL